MKKLVTLSMILVFVFVLSSCEKTIEDPDPIIIPDPPITTCDDGQVLDEQTDECIDLIETDLVVVDTKDLVDAMSYFDLSQRQVDIYHYLDETTPYIDIQSFMKQIRGTLVALDFEVDEVLTISYSSEDDYYRIIFDADNNQITINDLDIYSVMNGPIYSPPSLLQVESYEYIGIPQETIIALDQYDMHIRQEDGKYYIPLYLAGLFITGNAVSVYETADSIVLFDNGSDLTEVEYYANRAPKQDTLDILHTSENYLKLYFEYFYGLQDELGYDFDMLIESYGLDQQTSFDLYYQTLEQFLIDLDDIHTSFLFAGYNVENYSSNVNYETGSRWETILDALGTNKCYFLTSEYDYFIEGATMYVTVNGFSENTGSLVSDIISDSSGIENVVIDLRCNSGGSLIGVLELMTLLTDSPIPLNIYNPQTGIYEKQEVVNIISRAIDANFYVLTSEVTFSGGNLFASYVKDLNAGILLGTPSSGGACAIGLTVLPDGSIIVASSNTILRNANDEITEWGIIPDILISEYISDLTEFEFSMYIE